MARHDPRRADAEGLRRLHVVELAQLQGLGAQQPAQPRPAGQAEHRAQQKELEVGALEAGLEQLRVLVDEHLHHQHASRDQEDVRDRRQDGVQILDRLVDPASEIAADDAQDDRQRQGRERGQRADDECRADAFERMVQHIVAGHVGAEHVVAAHQRANDAADQRHPEHGSNRGTPRDHRLAVRDLSRGIAPRFARAASDHGNNDGADQRRHQQATDDPGKGSQRDIAGPLLARPLEMRAAEMQTRSDPLDAAVDLDRFSGEALVRERARVGRLARVEEPPQRRVEHRLGSRVVGHAALGRTCGRRQHAAEMHAVGERDHDADEQHDGRRERRRIAEDLAPRRDQVRTPANVKDVGDGRDDQQPDRGIGPEQDEFRHGAASTPAVPGGRPRSRRCRSARSSRCTAASR